MKKAVQEHGRDEFREDVWNELAAGMRYVATDFADDAGEDERRRGARASSTRSEGRAGNRVYYLAVPPAAFETIVERARRAPQRRRAGRG